MGSDMRDKLESGCLLALVPLTIFIAVPSVISITFGIVAIIFDLMRPVPPNAYPTLPSLASAYVILPLIALAPVALLWVLFYLAVRKARK